MTGVRINELGPTTELARDGTQIDNHASGSGYLPYKMTSMVVHTLSTTGSGFVATPGLQQISGAFAVTVNLPTASLHPGAMFAFQNTSGKAHVVTASDGSSIVYQRQITDVGVGSKLTLAASVTGSCILFCDGLKFNVLMASGSTVSGT
jgi:hypothetical protein